MTQSWRLPGGGRIDRSRRLEFGFDGERFEGYAGDTLASALLAAGVRLVGRSFRLHRPRGVLSCGIEESNALVHVRLGRYSEPNVRATVMPLVSGLEILSQNHWPRLRWDLGAFYDLLPKLWSAGFYHKTFIWPSWGLYEPFIRRMAGIGRVSEPCASSGTFMQQDMEVEILVCGGGHAGLAAATAAAAGGAAVTLLHSGGEPTRDAARPSQGSESVRTFLNTQVVGIFGHKVVWAVQDLGWGLEGPRRCLLRIRARSVVIATGAIEQPLVFEHNDRPGVMLAGAVSKYLDRYAVRAGRNAVLVTNNDRAYGALERWRAAGLEIAAVIDSRAHPGPAAEAAASQLRLPLIKAPQSFGVRGRLAVHGIEYRATHGGRVRIDCDLVAMSGGWIPNVHLYSQGLGELCYEPGLHAYAPTSQIAGLYAVGESAGLADLEVIRAHAAEVGRAAAAYASVGGHPGVSWPARPDLALGPTRFSGRAHRQWLDFQHDVTVADAEAAVKQGHTQVEHFKRYTTVGMSVDQGKTSLRNALEQLSEHSGQSLTDLRPPTYRPPYAPLSLAAAAGPNVGQWYRPERRLPAHLEHERLRAHFDDMGGWRRPSYYASAPSPQECIRREVHAVRNAVGLFDSSPLGKLEVSGPDALEFLDRLYVNSLKSLAPGRIRYVMMTRDNGVIMDDGTISCVAPNEFLITTTSGNADRVYLWMREWAECEWPQLEVLITPLTTAWGSITVSGPRARNVLKRAGTDIDVAVDAFPHMTLRVGEAAGSPARIYRVSFTGEVSYEINVASNRAAGLWNALAEAGASDEIQPYGIDALNIMRTEKGYLHVGADTDSTTTPLDLGWGALIERKSGDFVGRGALALPEYRRANRLQLIGVQAEDEQTPLQSGAHLINSPGSRSEGYVTSSYFSPTLGCAVALGRLEGGLKRIGERMLAYDQGSTVPVRVVKPVFYDPDNTRLRA
jgi:sarcosine oxidase subunit alpha